MIIEIAAKVHCCIFLLISVNHYLSHKLYKLDLLLIKNKQIIIKLHFNISFTNILYYNSTHLQFSFQNEETSY